MTFVCHSVVGCQLKELSRKPLHRQASLIHIPKLVFHFFENFESFIRSSVNFRWHKSTDELILLRNRQVNVDRHQTLAPLLGTVSTAASI